MLNELQKNCPLGLKKYADHQSVIQVGEARFGTQTPVIIAGPCSIESMEQASIIARGIKQYGARVFRGGAFKPRTNPYDFQGLGREALAILQAVKKNVDIPVVTEVMDTKDIEIVSEVADILQVGSRNMHNMALLKALGKQTKPILLKRGMAATVYELLCAAEYILLGGNQQVILCERGIRTFETCTRNTLDLNAVAYLKQTTHLPVIVDPSHATGLPNLIGPLSRASLACGADGLMIEVHYNPKEALSDAHQALDLTQFANCIEKLNLLNLSCA